MFVLIPTRGEQGCITPIKSNPLSCPVASGVEMEKLDSLFFTLASLTFTALVAKAGHWHFPAQQLQGWMMSHFHWRRKWLRMGSFHSLPSDCPDAQPCGTISVPR